MTAGVFNLPAPHERAGARLPARVARAGALKARLDEMAGRKIEIPMVIGGREVRTGRTATVVMPHDHDHVLAEFHRGGEAEVAQAIEAAAAAREEWSRTPWEARAAVFLRAAELLAGPWRDTLNAATMLGQSKTVYQAEIDAACELVDFWRFNVDLHAPADERAAGLVARHVEPDRVPAARGLRVRRRAVQLHRHLRQPADRAGADGQHGRVQAGVDRRLLGALPHEAVRGGRAAARA